MKTLLERALDRIEKADTGCWLWQGPQNVGYGRISLSHGVQANVHRFMYEQLVGPIPDGLVIDHLCRVKLCCNPEHLEPVTNAENIRRGVGAAVKAAEKEARTHCSKGHPLTADNEVRLADGRRGCRACARERNRNFDDRTQTRRRGPKVAVTEHRGQTSYLACGHVIVRTTGNKPRHMLCSECDQALAALAGGHR